MDDGIPVGQRFSHVYLPRGLPLPDSVRMRNRLSSLLRVFDTSMEMKGVVERELGVRVPIYPNCQIDWTSFFAKAELRDVLDSITLVYKFCFRYDIDKNRASWLSNVERVLREENARYTLDHACGVHLAVDAEYEREAASAVAGLGTPRYTASKHAFDAAQAAQDRADPDFKEALRNVFEAVEVVFKLILPETKRISGRDIGEKLKPLMATVYPDSPTAVTVAGQYLDSMCAWVNSVHNYRHGQPLEEAPQPPLDLSVALMSSGVAYLRWLIGIDQMIQAKAK